MKTKLFLVDVDGVTGNLVDYILDYLRDRFPDDTIPTVDKITEFHIDNFVTEEQWTAAVELLDAPGAASSIEPYAEAIEGIQSILDAGHRVQWLTSHWKTSPTWVYDRTQWLNRHFDADPYDILYGHNKWLVRGDVFIDDKIENIERWSEAWPEGRGVLMERPWNQDCKLPKLRSWDRVKELF